MRRRHMWKWLAILLAIVVCGLFFFLSFEMRIYDITSLAESFRESANVLANPNQGFYSLYGFRIEPGYQEWESSVEERLSGDSEQVLTLVEINLQSFRNSDIPAMGIENVDRLLSCFENSGKRLILRFLYDWNGKASISEPDNIDQILRHMAQLSSVLKQHEKKIFLYQGLWIGNWGEMNGTPFANQEDISKLSSQLASAAGDKAILSVRTPVQWRMAEEQLLKDPAKLDYTFSQSRVGLYNDGMLGSGNDCGTYGDGTHLDGALKAWSRAEELAFQDQLCCYVPNGGEVILDNPFNDFENAIRDLRTMHVSYLNADYDRTVLEKWERSVYSGEDCYDGMNGLEYIERHLGYRFYIDSPHVEYSFIQNKMTLGANLKNSGFAPVYSEKEVYLTLKNAEQAMTMKCPQDLRRLTGGNQSEESVFFGVSVPVSELNGTEYEIYMDIWDPVNQQRILLANEQEPGEDGYFLGTVSFAHAAGYETIRELFQN